MQLIVHLILVYLHQIYLFVKPTIAFVIPPVPVNVGEAKFAFKFNAANCALLVYLHQIYYLHLLNQPLLLLPLTVPVNVG
jgi:hypothetical protein